MGYHLGVDLGTTFVAAAIANDSRVEMFTLGDRTVVTPSVVFLGEDGSIVSGEGGQQARREHPRPRRARVQAQARRPHPGDARRHLLRGDHLLGALLHDVVNRITETEGASRTASC